MHDIENLQQKVWVLCDPMMREAGTQRNDGGAIDRVELRVASPEMED
jgi:hypothetical protein